MESSGKLRMVLRIQNLYLHLAVDVGQKRRCCRCVLPFLK